MGSFLPPWIRGSGKYDRGYLRSGHGGRDENGDAKRYLLTFGRINLTYIVIQQNLASLAKIFK
jgi:hypothetical protein